MTEVGFIILRHVDSDSTNKYWVQCYQRIRKYYPENAILIVDDNSNHDFITNEALYKTTVVASDYPGRGELLPYYYYLQHNLFDTAVILHDSVFINKCIDFRVETYQMIWDFDHDPQWDQADDVTRMLTLFNDDEIVAFHNDRHLWKGCFGGMTVIKHAFLKHINAKYDLRLLLDVVRNRYNRCSFERVIACLLQKEAPTTTMFGDIHTYCRWGTTISEINSVEVSALPLIKVWTGR